MRRLWWLAIFAGIGLIVAIVTVVETNRPPETSITPLPEVAPPFKTYVVGTGLTENRRGNVAVGTAVAGVVQAVDVRVGDTVVAGQALFRIDDRDLRARRDVAQADLQQAQAASSKPRHRLDYLAQERKLAPADVAAATITEARDEAAAAEAAVQAARATQAQLDTDLDRLVMRAPAAGRILQVNIRAGEFADSNPAAPLVLLGDDARMYLRVEVDENDAWRVRPGARGWAVARGNPRLSVPLRYEYTEPYITPKATLSGLPTERPDQRVLQVIYSFAPGTLPLHLGQRLDAYIQAPPAR